MIHVTELVLQKPIFPAT